MFLGRKRAQAMALNWEALSPPEASDSSSVHSSDQELSPLKSTARPCNEFSGSSKEFSRSCKHFSASPLLTSESGFGLHEPTIRGENQSASGSKQPSVLGKPAHSATKTPKSKIHSIAVNNDSQSSSVSSSASVLTVSDELLCCGSWPGSCSGSRTGQCSGSCLGSCHGTCSGVVSYSSSQALYQSARIVNGKQWPGEQMARSHRHSQKMSSEQANGDSANSTKYCVSSEAEFVPETFRAFKREMVLMNRVGQHVREGRMCGKSVSRCQNTEQPLDTPSTSQAEFAEVSACNGVMSGHSHIRLGKDQWRAEWRREKNLELQRTKARQIEESKRRFRERRERERERVVYGTQGQSEDIRQQEAQRREAERREAERREAERRVMEIVETRLEAQRLEQAQALRFERLEQEARAQSAQERALRYVRAAERDRQRVLQANSHSDNCGPAPRDEYNTVDDDIPPYHAHLHRYLDLISYDERFTPILRVNRYLVHGDGELCEAITKFSKFNLLPQKTNLWNISHVDDRDYERMIPVLIPDASYHSNELMI